MKWKNDVVVFYTNADVAVILVVVDVDDVFACNQQQKKHLPDKTTREVVINLLILWQNSCHFWQVHLMAGTCYLSVMGVDDNDCFLVYVYVFLIRILIFFSRCLVGWLGMNDERMLSCLIPCKFSTNVRIFVFYYKTLFFACLFKF